MHASVPVDALLALSVPRDVGSGERGSAATVVQEVGGRRATWEGHVASAIAGHVLLGFDLSLSSMMGLVALAGVVVNDSLLLVVTCNELRARGVPLDEAIVAAGSRRFRPILLTSLTTFLGLAPIIFETSFGLLFATLIVVLLVPALDRILEDLTHRSERATTRVFGAREQRAADRAFGRGHGCHG